MLAIAYVIWRGSKNTVTLRFAGIVLKYEGIVLFGSVSKSFIGIAVLEVVQGKECPS